MTWKNQITFVLLLTTTLIAIHVDELFASDQEWVSYPGKGKHIVLVSGDEEYRSEEALPQLGKILAKHHGFKCTVLFAIDPKTGKINPNIPDNIPGLENLKSADLMIISTRFRALPNEQMQYIDNYLKSGRPVIGMRTATHAFRFTEPGRWSHYGNGYSGERKEWTDGFGRLVLGEKWVSHHGKHKHESTLGIIPEDAKNHAIVRGLKDGDIWGPTDTYTVRRPLPGDSKALVLGRVMRREGEFDDTDPFYGMRPDDSIPVEEKNNPMMPVAWTKTYQIPGGTPGRVFTSTMGAATDLVSEGVRKMFVNAVFWCLGMENKIPAAGTNVDLVGDYEPSAYQARRGNYWPERAMALSEYSMEP